jgi:predicted small lipoprotein YifL
MLRRSVAALLITVAFVAGGCGIKGPLRLPPAKPGSPDATAAPQPSRPSSETPSPEVPTVTSPEGRMD